MQIARYLPTRISHLFLLLVAFFLLSSCMPRIYSAVSDSNLQHIKQYIEEGDQVNTCKMATMTPITAAAKDGNLEVVEFLLKNGADPHKTCGSGPSALYFAQGNNSLVKPSPDIVNLIQAHQLVKEGKYLEAISLQKRILSDRERNLGPDHPDVAKSLGKLAVLYIVLKQYSKAEPLCERKLEILDKALGPDHPDVAMSLDSLARTYFLSKQYSRAEPLFQRAIRIGEKTLGSDHPDVAIFLDGLAQLHRVQKKYSSAESLFKRSIRIYEKSLEPDDLNLARALAGLSMNYGDQGQYSSAVPLLKRSLRIYEITLGSEHPEVITHKQLLQVVENLDAKSENENIESSSGDAAGVD